MIITLGATSVLARIIARANALTRQHLDASDCSILYCLCCLCFSFSAQDTLVWEREPGIFYRILEKE